VIRNLFEVGEHLQIKIKSWEHYDGQYNFSEHLLVSSWEQFEENSRHLGFLGAPDESLGSTFGSGSTGWETLT
jgi:hypothetical protein